MRTITVMRGMSTIMKGTITIMRGMSIITTMRKERGMADYIR